MKQYKLLVDPPSGWQYGFPKEIPEEFTNEAGDKIEDRVGYNMWFDELYPLETGWVRFMTEENVG